MFTWFAWMLDARLHLALVVSLLASAIGREGPLTIPAVDSPFDGVRVVRYLDDAETIELMAPPISGILSREALATAERP